MRENDSAIPPLTGTAAPAVAVPAPRATMGMWCTTRTHNGLHLFAGTGKATASGG